MLTHSSTPVGSCNQQELLCESAKLQQSSTSFNPLVPLGNYVGNLPSLYIYIFF